MASEHFRKFGKIIPVIQLLFVRLPTASAELSLSLSYPRWAQGDRLKYLLTAQPARGEALKPRAEFSRSLTIHVHLRR